MSSIVSAAGNFISLILSAIAALFIATLLVIGFIKLFRVYQKVNRYPMGSGRPTKEANHGLSGVMGCFALSLIIGTARLILWGFNFLSLLFIGLPLLALLLAIWLASSTKKKYAAARSDYREQQIDDMRQEVDMIDAKAQKQSAKIMAAGGAKVVKAKVDTAVAQEQAKTSAVRASMTHIRVGAVENPREALEYANASGALTEGKELADKFADKYMGENAPTVIDGEYADVTEEAKAVMSDGDEKFVESIKSIGRDTLESTVRLGAQQLMFEIEGKTVETIAGEILSYAPGEYLKSLPDSLTDVEKAYAIVAREANGE